MVGTTVLHYEIIQLLGQGAMGAVYKARDVRLDTFRALKFLQPGKAEIASEQTHLVDEARTQAKLFHPNIATLLVLEEIEDQSFLVIEYVDGPTLDVYLAGSDLSLKDRFRLVLQVASALEAAHGHGILHRDIKPSNVLVTPEGTAKVTDFGLAKVLGQSTITATGGTRGTAPYMPPEAFRGERTDESADVWSLGVLAYEVLEGRRPFRGDSFEAVAYHILNEPHLPLSGETEEALPGITEFLDNSLVKDPGERIHDGHEALSVLIGIASSAGVDYSVSPAVSRPASRGRRLYGRGVIATAVIVPLAMLAGWFLFGDSTGSRIVQESGGWRAAFNESSPTWDSAGRRIAFVTESDGPRLNIRNTTHEGTGAAIVPLPSEINFESASWAPNDTLFALLGEEGLHIFNYVTGRIQRITGTDVDNPSWSSDSRYLVYRNSDSEGGQSSGLELIGPLSSEDGETISTVEPESLSVAGGLPGPLTLFELYDPVFILNDSRICFVVDEAAKHRGLWSVPVEGGEAAQLVGGEFWPWRPQWDEKNRRLFFFGWAEQEIYSLKVGRKGRATGSPKPLGVSGSMQSGEEIVWMDYDPSTRQLVSRTKINSQDIWRIPMSADSEPIVSVVSKNQGSWTPHISMDQKRLYYSAVEPGSGLRVRCLNLNSGLDDYLCSGWNPNYSTAWYPTPEPVEDERFVVFVASSGESMHDLYAYDRERDRIFPLAGDRIEGPGVATCPAWSADRAFIYYVRKADGEGALCDIRRIPVTSTGTVLQCGDPQIIHSDRSLKYPLPDNSGRVLMYESDSFLYIMDMETKQRKLMVEGNQPTLNPSREDAFYIKDETIYRLRNWARGLTETITPEPVRTLSASTHGVFALFSTLTAGDDALYATLAFSDVGEIRIVRLRR